jgi:hypothetical protein
MDRMGAVLKRAIEANPGRSSVTAGPSASNRAEVMGPCRQEKPLARSMVCPYRKPTLVGRGNSPQVIERPSVKELGKLTPYLRKKGCPSIFPIRGGERGLQELGSTDCLPKTQVSANAKAEV